MAEPPNVRVLEDAPPPSPDDFVDRLVRRHALLLAAAERLLAALPRCHHAEAALDSCDPGALFALRRAVEVARPKPLTPEAK